jgi:hypothetical protein
VQCPSVSANEDDSCSALVCHQRRMIRAVPQYGHCEGPKIIFNLILVRVDYVHEVRRLRIPITKITETHMVASKYRLMHSAILLY